jgi:hypothetical protein
MSDCAQNSLTLSALPGKVLKWEEIVSDGPFRNLKLSNKWKRYGDQLASDAASPEERVEQACGAILGDVDSKSVSALYWELRSMASQSQLDLIPGSTLQLIFDKREPSIFAHKLSRHVVANMQNGDPILQALDAGMVSAISDLLEVTKNRLDEHCIEARALGDMKGEAFHIGLKRNSETFATIDHKAIGEALIAGKTHVFNGPSKRRTGVDDGPED